MLWYMQQLLEQPWFQFQLNTYFFPNFQTPKAFIIKRDIIAFQINLKFFASKVNEYALQLFISR